MPQSVLTLYACGRTTGLTIDVGLHSSRVAPIVEGRVVRSAVHAARGGGALVTSRLRALLASRNAASSSLLLDVDTCNALKDAYAYAMPASQSIGATSSTHAIGVLSDAPRAGDTFQLPDGKQFDVEKASRELADCVEALFVGSSGDDAGLGLVDAMYASLLDCPQSERAALLAGVSVGGGGTAVRGFDARVAAELRALATNAGGTTTLVAAATSSSLASAGAGAAATLAIGADAPSIADVKSAVRGAVDVQSTLGVCERERYLFIY